MDTGNMDQRVNPDMLRQLRRERAWTQEHLARAAGLATRTVQRAEDSGRCAAESVLAMAGALNVEVGQLGAIPEDVDPGELGSAAGRPVALPGPVTRLLSFLLLRRLPNNQRAAWTLLASLPAVYFVAANVLHYQLGISWLYNPLQTLLAGPVAGTLFDTLSPVLFLGGLGWALVTNLDAMLRIEIQTGRTGIRPIGIKGWVALTPRLGNSLVLAMAGGFLAILLLYLLVENLGPGLL